LPASRIVPPATRTLIAARWHGGAAGDRRGTRPSRCSLRLLGYCQDGLIAGSRPSSGRGERFAFGAYPGNEWQGMTQAGSKRPKFVPPPAGRRDVC
jgi:hypothetical protein